MKKKKKKTWFVQCRDLGSIFGQGTNIPHASHRDQNLKKNFFSN